MDNSVAEPVLVGCCVVAERLQTKRSGLSGLLTLYSIQFSLANMGSKLDILAEIEAKPSPLKDSPPKKKSSDLPTALPVCRLLGTRVRALPRDVKKGHKDLTCFFFLRVQLVHLGFMCMLLQVRILGWFSVGRFDYNRA